MIDIRIGEARLRPVIEIDFLEHPADVVPGVTQEDAAPFLDQLGPAHFDPETLHAHQSHHSWLIEVNGVRIIVDPCVGTRDYELLPFFHRVQSTFLEQLEAMGAPPESIDYVFCTHMHFDHIGWNTRTVDGKLVPTFPNARYLFSRVENEYWKWDLEHEEPRSIYNVGAYGECIQPIIDAGLAELVEDGYRIADCMTLIDAIGHTIGHMAGVLESAGEGAVFVGDAIHHPLQVIFADRPAHGYDTEQLLATRRKLLDICADRDFWLAPAHFRAPHVCKIRKAGDGYEMLWADQEQETANQPDLAL